MSDADERDDYEDEIAPEGNRIAGGRTRAVVEHVARSIVDDADAVRVDTQEGADRISLMIHAAPDDMGRLIGRRGRVIQAIRQVARATGSLEDVQVEVDVAD